jgi:hypothetical protein
MKSVCLLLDSGDQVAWVFLAPGRFGAKTPIYRYWILLDFLGFSRPNRGFSMGYTAQSEQSFFSSVPS